LFRRKPVGPFAQNVAALLCFATILLTPLMDGALGIQEPLKDLLLTLDHPRMQVLALELADRFFHLLGDSLQVAQQISSGLGISAHFIELLLDRPLLSSHLLEALLSIDAEAVTLHLVQELLDFLIQLLLLRSGLLHLLDELLETSPAAATGRVHELVHHLGKQESQLVQMHHGCLLMPG